MKKGYTLKPENVHTHTHTHINILILHNLWAFRDVAWVAADGLFDFAINTNIRVHIYTSCTWCFYMTSGTKVNEKKLCANVKKQKYIVWNSHDFRTFDIGMAEDK